MKLTTLRWLLLGLLLLTAGAIHAEGNCPPGYYPIGASNVPTTTAAMGGSLGSDCDLRANWSPWNLHQFAGPRPSRTVSASGLSIERWPYVQDPTFIP
jgi:hypothetical protein